ncbi:Uncharacterised protein [Sphingobacterium spiritivorum]|uniref:Uncharacterized protein n=1 Tax=Sphingobacterium spiritivorum TaxID=258 RepID=A0A380CVW5_SPHSI|nr:Uncharacterised protein [Sphingobacterium spiritivorum]
MLLTLSFFFLKEGIIMRYRLYIYYLKNILFVNFAISGLFAVFTPTEILFFKNPYLSSFSFLFTTIGYASTALVFHYFGKKTKYMYFNAGISFFRIYMFGFLSNLLFVFILYVIVEML